MTSAATAAPVPHGFPNRGWLESASDLHALIKGHSDILVSVSPAEFQFGTDELAQVLLKIGAWGTQFTHQPVWVGDTSLRKGGKLALHMTHQRGLDADIAYLVRSHRLSGHRSKKYHDRFTEQFGVGGKGFENFDLESTYQLLGKILREVSVLRIFVGCGIYDALEKYDRGQSASIMAKIFAQKGHEDHFHLRLKCPASAKDCSEDWWEGKAPAHPRKKKKKERPKVGPDGKWRDCARERARLGWG